MTWIVTCGTSAAINSFSSVRKTTLYKSHTGAYKGACDAIIKYAKYLCKHADKLFLRQTALLIKSVNEYIRLGHYEVAVKEWNKIAYNFGSDAVYFSIEKSAIRSMPKKISLFDQKFFDKALDLK